MGTKYNDALEQGRNGGTLIADTTATTGTFGGFLVLNDTVINAITADAIMLNSTDIEDSVTLPAGLYVPLQFSAITLTSGVIIAYNSN